MQDNASMSPDLSQLADADTSHAIEIADRVWWVGHVLDDDIFQCHVYLLEQGDQSVLFDPGSRLTFAGTLRKIEEVIPFTKIRYFVCHHQDPDIAAALPLIDQMVDREDAVVVTHWRAQALLKHYGLRLPFWLVDQHDWRLQLLDRELQFVFTPYAHFPGAICGFDPSTRVLFSSDLFGGFTEKPTLLAKDESHFEVLRPFHEHYMPSRAIRDIAERLFEIVRNNLPASRIDYYAPLDDDQILTLSHDTRFDGLTAGEPETVRSLLGKTRAEWEAAHRQDPAMRDHQLHPRPFCSQPDGEDGLALTLPLFSPERERMEAVAIIHLETMAAIPHDMDLLVQQLMTPLQVALEREVIYRRIEQERHRAYQRSIRDSLTGLFTRVYRQDVVARQCSIDDRAEVTALAAVTLDLDHVKQINDNHGHAAGDAVLHQCTDILRRTTRATDIPVRFGGEDFIVGTDALGAAEFAERLRRGIEEHAFDVGIGQPLPVTANIGVATRKAGENMDALIRRADEALYVAKRNGRNQVRLAEDTPTA
jgi:diguanylate cyclase (GGDEF)-like protein